MTVLVHALKNKTEWIIAALPHLRLFDLRSDYTSDFTPELLLQIIYE